MANTLERRTELLKLESMGLSRAQTVKDLTKKYGVSHETVYSDFRNREKWQPKIQGFEDQKQALLKTINDLERLQQKAKMYVYVKKDINDNVRVAWAKLLDDVSLKLLDLQFPRRQEYDFFIHKDRDEKPKIDFNKLPAKDRKALFKAEEVLHSVASNSATT